LSPRPTVRSADFFDRALRPLYTAAWSETTPEGDLASPAVVRPRQSIAVNNRLSLTPPPSSAT